MASDLFVFDGSVHRHPNSDDIDIDLQYFADPSSIDILQAILDDSSQKDPTDQTAPPSHQMQSLSLTRFQPHPDSNPASDPDFFSAFDLTTEVENHHGSFESASNPTSDLFDYHRHICLEESETMMQRNFSSHSFDGPPGFLLQSRFDSLVAESGHMRRVCSTGDLEVGTGQGCRRFSSESSSVMEEATGFKVGRYSAEERKERIHRYRAKRSQRNFNKTIKYACRKTLADNRPRVRGRFARNDDAVETPKPTCSNPYEDEEDIWIEGFNAELEDYGTVRGGHFFNSLGATLNQYYGFGH